MDALSILVETFGYALCVILPFVALMSWRPDMFCTLTIDVPDDIVPPFPMVRPVSRVITVTPISYKTLPTNPCPVAHAESVVILRSMEVR